MAVVSVQETAQRDHEVAFDPARGWVRAYRRTFLVITNDPADGPLVVRGALPVALGNPYVCGATTDIFAFCMAIRVRCVDEDGNGWEATVEYGPHDPSIRPENPLEQPPEVSTDFAIWQRQVDVDRNGVRVLNSAGVPFDPTIPYDDTRPLVRVTRNEATFSLALAYQYRDAVNANDWLGAPTKTVKASPVKFRRLWHPVPGYYYQGSYEFEFNPEGWTRKVLDAGLNEVLSSGDRVRITDKKGIPVTVPVPLDGDGLAIDEPTPGSIAFIVATR